MVSVPSCHNSYAVKVADLTLAPSPELSNLFWYLNLRRTMTKAITLNQRQNNSIIRQFHKMCFFFLWTSASMCVQNKKQR